MPRLNKCPDCGGKMERGETNFITESEQGLIAIENLDADICTICGTEYLTAESDEYVEQTMENISAKKIPAHKETVFRIATKTHMDTVCA